MSWEQVKSANLQTRANQHKFQIFSHYPLEVVDIRTGIKPCTVRRFVISRTAVLETGSAAASLRFSTRASTRNIFQG